MVENIHDNRNDYAYTITKNNMKYNNMFRG